MKKFNLVADHTQQDIFTALGISEERKAQLGEIIQRHGESDRTITETLAGIASECNSDEELAVSIFCFGEHYGEEAANPLKALFGGMVPAGDDEDDEDEVEDRL